MRIDEHRRPPEVGRFPGQSPADALVPRRAGAGDGQGLRQHLPDREAQAPRSSARRTRSRSSSWPRRPASRSPTPSLYAGDPPARAVAGRAARDHQRRSSPAPTRTRCWPRSPSTRATWRARLGDDPHDQLDPGQLVVAAAVGAHAAEVRGQSVPARESISGEVMRTGQPLVTEDASSHARRLSADHPARARRAGHLRAASGPRPRDRHPDGRQPQGRAPFRPRRRSGSSRRSPTRPRWRSSMGERRPTCGGSG